MPAIVLLTDFGSRDYYVGVMKGVISSMNPVARVIDLTHDIEPQNIKQGAFVLWASRKYFPDDSIFVSVVDPGVGSDRRIICGSIEGRLYLAPDNGLLDYVVAESAEHQFRTVTNRNLFLRSVSTTFHGRDIFAPIAAHLSRGLRLNELGESFSYPRCSPFYTSISTGKNMGEVVYQDRFGNVFTSFLWREELLQRGATLKIGNRVVTKFAATYSAALTKGLIGIKGSSGLLEVAVNGGSAARVLKSAVGDRVALILK